jgi:hypothetical protein
MVSMDDESRPIVCSARSHVGAWGCCWSDVSAGFSAKVRDEDNYVTWTETGPHCREATSTRLLIDRNDEATPSMSKKDKFQ